MCSRWCWCHWGPPQSVKPALNALFLILDFISFTIKYLQQWTVKLSCWMFFGHKLNHLHPPGGLNTGNRTEKLWTVFCLHNNKSCVARHNLQHVCSLITQNKQTNAGWRVDHAHLTLSSTCTRHTCSVLTWLPSHSCTVSLCCPLLVQHRLSSDPDVNNFI